MQWSPASKKQMKCTCTYRVRYWRDSLCFILHLNVCCNKIICTIIVLPLELWCFQDILKIISVTITSKKIILVTITPKKIILVTITPKKFILVIITPEKIISVTITSKKIILVTIASEKDYIGCYHVCKRLYRLLPCTSEKDYNGYYHIWKRLYRLLSHLKKIRSVTITSEKIRSVPNT
jgi:hypothetical protein